MQWAALACWQVNGLIRMFSFFFLSAHDPVLSFPPQLLLKPASGRGYEISSYWLSFWEGESPWLEFVGYQQGLTGQCCNETRCIHHRWHDDLSRPEGVRRETWHGDWGAWLAALIGLGIRPLAVIFTQRTKSCPDELNNPKSYPSLDNPP